MVDAVSPSGQNDVEVDKVLDFSFSFVLIQKKQKIKAS